MLSFPSSFCLIAAMNPCPCGFFGVNSRSQHCWCSPGQIMRYRTRISGPLYDRIDIHIEVSIVPPSEIIQPVNNEPSAKIKQRVNQARKRQVSRFRNTNTYFNARMSNKQIKKFCSLNDSVKLLLRQAINELGLSARAYDKILKVSRTIADLSGQNVIQPEHVAEAIQYRNMDRGLWG